MTRALDPRLAGVFFMFKKVVHGLFLACLAVPANVAHAEEKPRKTNVLLIVSDDLNMCAGTFGHAMVKTPNLDRLAARGVRFTRAYAQYPLCNPSRTSFMSGRRPTTTKVFDNNTPPRTTLGDIQFMNEYFRAHGYFTGRVGKIFHGAYAATSTWDISEEPGKKGGKGKKQKDAKDNDELGGLKITWRATDNNDEDEPDGKTARRVAELITKNKDRPFFLAAGFHKPHLAFIAPKKYFDLYPPEKITLPVEPAGARKNVPAQAFTSTKGDDKMTDAQKKQALAAYYACVTFVDTQVGIVLDSMDQNQLWENTIVIFISDHGFHLLEHGLWRKMTLFEEATHVPMIVAAPGGKKGAVSPRLVELADLYPTLTEFCKLPAPGKLEGISLTPLLQEPEKRWKDAAFTTVKRGKVMGTTVVTERYRYTEWGDEKLAELYDHQSDPRELNNLATAPDQLDVLREMRVLLNGGWEGALQRMKAAKSP
jgi:iduronate 2-sulfatase